MTRLTRAVTAVVGLTLLASCSSGAPQGTTLPPLTTSAATTDAVSSSAVSTPSDTSGSESAPVSGSVTESVESSASEVVPSEPPAESVPAEASALPLPTEQVNVPADSPQEEADRAAIEAVWRQVWDFYQAGYDMTPEEISAEANKLLAGPLRDQFIDGFLSDSSRKLVGFGSITLHPYWYEPVGGSEYAMIGDCSDYSAFGVKDRISGEVVNQGKPNLNTVGHFIKDDSGSWKLWQVSNLEAVPCVV